MEVKEFTSNSILELAANTYLVIDSGSCVVIDPSKDDNEVIDYIKTNKLSLKAILLTHGHFDHIRGVNRLYKEFGVKLYIHKEDIELLTNTKLNCSDNFSRYPVAVNIPSSAIIEIKDGEQLDLLNASIKVIHTPYHTMGSVCFYLKDNNLLFSGDSLFKGSIGRYDLPTSRPSLIKESMNKILLLLKETSVYPGHGETTSIRDAF